MARTNSDISETAPTGQIASEQPQFSLVDSYSDENKFDIIVFNGLSFILNNSEKLSRVIDGVMTASGQRDGLGIDADPAEVIAQYDKIGGAIFVSHPTAGRCKIERGSFYDFKKKCKRGVPVIKYVFRVSGENIIINDPSELALAMAKVSEAVEKKQEETEKLRERAHRKRIA